MVPPDSTRFSTVNNPEAIPLTQMSEETLFEAHVESRADREGARVLLAGIQQSDKNRRKILFVKLGVTFFIFGLINNVLYVIILSAALDLVPPSTPKGIIAFCNIAPSLVAKVGWPYVLKGKVRYRRRIIGCCALSVLGMVVIAGFESLNMRLLGISLASFSSGLGELSFLQLSTTYHPLHVAGQAVGYFASGTGGAGIVGAALWWFVRSLGVKLGIGLSAVLPLMIPVTYAFLLPPARAFLELDTDNSASDTATSSEYHPLPMEDEDAAAAVSIIPPKYGALTSQDKYRLVKPLFWRYMVSLFAVYLFEYTINQGIAPTLVYPVPQGPIWSLIIKSIRDYYPLWQLVYQSTVFLSRSSLSVGFPPLPKRLLPLPAILQFLILFTLVLESSHGILDFWDEGWSIFCVFFFISIEGFCGGLAYVNTYYHVGQEESTEPLGIHSERARQEREFKIGSVGFADSLGIVFASLVSVPTEIELCKAQISRGKLLCKDL